MSAIGLVLYVVTVTFAAMHLMPGDPVRLYLGPAADATTVAESRLSDWIWSRPAAMRPTSRTS